ncbi:hypothetical protein D3C71_2098660 [compost metagenome]
MEGEDERALIRGTGTETIAVAYVAGFDKRLLRNYVKDVRGDVRPYFIAAVA